LGLFNAPDLDERHAEPSSNLDQDPDADQDLEDSEDLHPGVFENEVRIRDARRGQGGNGEIEAIDELPPVAKRVGDRAYRDQESSCAETSYPIPDVLRKPLFPSRGAWEARAIPTELRPRQRDSTEAARLPGASAD
jgi:hypothetical protein